MFFALIQVAAAVGALRTDAPPLALNAARTMTPTELGDALLAAGHPPIIQAIVHPAHMEAPAPWVTEVELLAAPHMSNEAGFCAVTLYTVTFDHPASPKWDVTSPNPVRPASLAAETLYKLPSPSPQSRSDACKAPIDDYFHLDPTFDGREFQLVRLLAAAQKAARSGHALSFDLSFKDKLADDLESAERSQPPNRVHSWGARLPDARAALIATPLDDIYHIGFDQPLGDQSIRPPPGPETCGQRECTAELFVGEVWRVDVVFTAHEIRRLHLERALPAPF